MTSFRSPQHEAMSGPFIMLISALLFGYFGFALAFPEINTATGDKIPMVVLLKWTLRVSAIAFAVAAALSLVTPLLSEALYSGVGILGALLFLVIAAWDFTSQFTSGIHPILLVIFALWNGYGSWAGLQMVMAHHHAARGTEQHHDQYLS